MQLNRHIRETVFSSYQSNSEFHCRSSLRMSIASRLSKTSIICTFLLSLLITILTTPAFAAVVTWDGGGVDTNWDTCANWNPSDICPGTADIATFNGTSSKNATIIENPDTGIPGIEIAGIEIQAGYGGVINQNGTPITIGTNGFSQHAGTFTGGSGQINVNGDLTISNGSFTATGTGTTTFISGNFARTGGLFFHNSGTINFNGINQSITGSNNFFDINKTTTSGRLTFPAGLTQNFAGVATFIGGTSAGTELIINSSLPGARANLNFNDTPNFDFLNLQDLDASGSTVTTPLNPPNTIDGGNTIGWFAVPDNNAVTSAVAEITPNSAFIGAANSDFSIYMQPTISAANTGFNQLVITTPPGYTNSSVARLWVNNVEQTLGAGCPTTVNANEYCTSISGQSITIVLGSKITSSSPPLQVDLNTDVSGLLGNHTFLLAVDDTATTGVPAQSVTAGNADSNIPSDSLTINQLMPGLAVTSVVAEVTPNELLSGSSGRTFSFYLRPTINSGDQGLNQVTITMPPDYTNTAIDAVMIDGASLTAAAACPLVNPSEYCAVLSGQNMVLNLGSIITTNLAEIRIDLISDTADVIKNTTLSFSVDDTTTTFLPAQTGTAGNADGNAANSNSLNINLSNDTQPLSTAIISPNVVIADGTSSALITVQLLNKDKQPLIGKHIQMTSNRGGDDTITQPASVTDINGIAQGTIRSSITGTAIISVLNTTDGILLPSTPQVHFTQGNRLTLTKTANKNEATTGELITYAIEIKNNGTLPVQQVTLETLIPNNFKYRKDSTLLNGAPASDPTGNRKLNFNLGTVPALIDTNGNGEADEGETGYARFDYQLIVGAGATPGSYRNSSTAKDSCDACSISNQATVDVSVTADPLFDLGTIIGKVFHDKNGDHWQDPNEPGIANAMVVLDEGTYAITDEHGRYHFPAVTPGERLLKLNLTSLPVGTTVNGNETQIISVSPGLLSKINFGAAQSLIVEKLGSPGIKGLKLLTETQAKNITLIGNAETQTINVNGSDLPLPQADVRMLTNKIPSEILAFKDKEIVHPGFFHIDVSQPDEVDAWQLQISTINGRNIHTFSGNGTPPAAIQWDGDEHILNQLDNNALYHYQLTVNYHNGTHASSARRIIGTQQKSTLQLNLSDDIFGAEGFTLNEHSKDILSNAAKLLRQYPRENVIIAGQSGAGNRNEAIAKRRVESAHAYLVGIEGISPFRLQLRWKDEDAANDSDAHPLLTRIILGKVPPHTETTASATLDGKPLQLDPTGRFTLIAKEHDLLIALTNKNGRTTSTRLVVPRFAITHPAGEILIPYFSDDTNKESSRADLTAEQSNSASHFQFTGQAPAASIINIGKETMQATDDGTFTYPMNLSHGIQSLQIEVKDPQGFSYAKTLTINVQSHQQNKQVYLKQPIPELQLNLPPAGFTVLEGDYTFTGNTSPENTVVINNSVIKIDSDGQFSHTLTLKDGKNPLHVKIIDRQGYVSTVEHMIGIGKPKLFFMAFADGKFSRLNTKGFIEGSGQKSGREFYSEGRLAFYLKGKIQGKYLITAALDTGQGEIDSLFNDLDDDGTKALLSNLDPDHYYPVYGDNSTVVYDTQSQGKFYLAVDSDTIHSVVGNFKLNLSDNELAAYRRTLYGALFEYKSLSRNQHGKPDTLVRLFGAQTRQRHIRDEIRATGGSLYYLSQREIIEGSEQVTLVVKDKTTGLTLSRQPQQQNIDYSIKYLAGRLLFNRPISSKQQDNHAINSALLAGNPVYIEVEYEYHVAAFEKTANGVHLRHQVTEQLAIGATHVSDELAAGRYELQGIDAEISIHQNSRIIAEIAQSSGSEGEVFSSDDGGLLFSPLSSSQQNGQAIKIATEIDIGEFSGKPDRMTAGAYIKKLDSGFQASGNSSDQGQQKRGADLMVRVTDNNTLRLKHDQAQNQNADATQADAVHSLQQSRAQWQYKQTQWSLTGELQDQSSQASSGAQLNKESLAAAKLTRSLTKKLQATVRHQSTLEGIPNNQNTLGLKYNLTQHLNIQGNATTGDRGDASEARLGYHSEKVNVYLTERLNDDQSGKTTSTIIGGETSIATIAGADSGKIYSEYQWDNSDHGDKALSLVGAEQQWKIENGWQFNLSTEYSDINTLSDTTNRSTVAVGLSYMGKGLKANTRYEIRNDRGTERKKQTLTSNNIEYNLNPDYILLGKYRHSITRNLTKNSVDARFDEHSIGLAYRPTAHDRLNALTRYTRLTDLRPLNITSVTAMETKMDVLSIEWSYQLTKKIEWADKQAIRFRTEQVGSLAAFKTQTHLSIHRLNYGLPWQLRMGLEYRRLTQKQANDQRSGWLSELTWEANRHMRLGLGYNFSDFSDNEFSANDFSTEGWFIRIQGKY